MRPDDLLTIITATYNSASTIRDTLDSVVQQESIPGELLVVDGGSTDETLSIVNSFKNKLPIRILFGPDNGIYDAMNKGLRHAKGDIIGFLNSDDILAYDRCIEDIELLFKKTATDIVYADLVYVSATDINKITRRWISGTYTKAKLNTGWCMPHPAFYIRRNVYKHIGEFNLDYDLAADYDFICRCLLSNKFNVEYLNRVIVKMREGGATNKSVKNVIKQNIQILNSVQNRKHYTNIPMFILRKLFLKVSQRLSK